MPLLFVRDNIVHMKTDAIVNAANTGLLPGGGVCGSVFDSAGFADMQQACRRIGFCGVGDAVITPGFALPARYVIHAVGPVWQGGGHNEQALLRECYLRSLKLAKQYGLESVAFPLISSGIYGYPKEEALQVAVAAISEFLLKNDMTVYIVVYDSRSFCLSEKLMQKVESYIDDRYVTGRYAYQHLQPGVFADAARGPEAGLSGLLAQAGETFSQALMRLIDARGEKDSQVYNRANIDRRLFSKIRSKKDYKPSKQTVLALCVALELSLEESRELLAKAGLALTRTSKFDIIVEYFLSQGNYDIFRINEVLFQFDQPLLGSV